MGSAKQGYPVVSRALAQAAARSPGAAAIARDARTTSCARASTTSSASRRTSSRSSCARRMPRVLSSRASSIACRTSRATGADDRRYAAGDGRPRADRRVGRSREGLLSTIVLEMGGSSDLCAMLKPGEPVILMGPTGTPTETPAGETSCSSAAASATRCCFSIGQTLRERGSQGPLLRRLQEARGSLQSGRDRGGGGRGRLVLR